MRVIFAGTADVAIPSLEFLHSSRHEIAAVLTRPDAPAGRKRTLTPSPVKTRAIELGLPVIEAARMRGDVIDRIAELRPDAIPIVAYGAIIGPKALAVPPYGWINLHFSRLPAWRGAAPVQRAIMAGDDTTAATTFVLDTGLDTGDILSTQDVPIGAHDTAGTLSETMAVDGARLLVDTLDGLEAGTTEPVAQPAGASYAEKLTGHDARIDWTAPSGRVDAAIRAVTPAPGAWTTAGGERYKLGPVEPHAEPRIEPRIEPSIDHQLDAGDLEPGRIRVGDDVLVGTGTRPVALTTVQPPGKKPMPAAEWSRGLRTTNFRFDIPDD